MPRCMPHLVVAIFSAMLTLLVSAGGAQADDAATPGAKSCTHYDNRARFASRAQAVTFPAVLADACAGAAATLADAGAPAPRRAAALAFLRRLDATRAAIADIDRARFAAARSASRNGGVGGAVRDLRRAYGMITETGEYLILRDAGVFAALGAWVDAGADFGLIAALPAAGSRR